MLDFPPKTGVFQVFRFHGFHNKSESHSYSYLGQQNGYAALAFTTNRQGGAAATDAHLEGKIEIQGDSSALRPGLG